MSGYNQTIKDTAQEPAHKPETLPGNDNAGAQAAHDGLQNDFLSSTSGTRQGSSTTGKEIFARERESSKPSSKDTPPLEIAMGPKANGNAAKGTNIGGKESAGGSFDLATPAVSKPVDANGRVPVDKFDQIPVKKVSVHPDGRISLHLHQETTVRQPNDPKDSGRRNQELRFGKKQADGTIPCSAEVITRTGRDGEVNHITLDRPANLKVAGEEFIGKGYFGVWKSGESDVKRAVFDNTKGQPRVNVTFNHPIYGETTTTKAIPKADFTQMVSWIDGARQRALSRGSSVADISSKANPLYAKD